MLEVIDQYGQRHHFDDSHCIHDAEAERGIVQIARESGDGDYEVVATFFHPARFGEVSDDTTLSLREAPPGIVRQIKELEAKLDQAIEWVSENCGTANGERMKRELEILK